VTVFGFVKENELCANIMHAKCNLCRKRNEAVLAFVLPLPPDCNGAVKLLQPHGRCALHTSLLAMLAQFPASYLKTDRLKYTKLLLYKTIISPAVFMTVKFELPTDRGR
jgi:hypothetical protein